MYKYIYMKIYMYVYQLSLIRNISMLIYCIVTRILDWMAYKCSLKCEQTIAILLKAFKIQFWIGNVNWQFTGIYKRWQLFWAEGRYILHLYIHIPNAICNITVAFWYILCHHIIYSLVQSIDNQAWPNITIKSIWFLQC